MSINGALVSNNNRFLVFNVYAPHHLSAKLEVWEALSILLQRNCNKAVCLIGDFNCVRDASKRKFCQYRNYDSQTFNNFNLDNKIFDVKVGNSHFTWCGRNNKMSRLDRALGNKNLHLYGSWEIKPF